MSRNTNWADIKVIYNGEEIYGLLPVQYKPKPLTATVYYKRRNKYYFKTNYGGKFCVESSQNIFKKGDTYNIEFN